MSSGIAGKVVIITGASSGLGAETARHLAARGATVVLAARRAERIEALARELDVAPARALAVVTDVADRDSLRRLAEKTIETYGRIDVLINNAGIMPLGPLDHLRMDGWDRMIDVNVRGVLYGIAAVLPHMQRQRSGHVINVSSMSGHRVLPGGAVYSATKFAVRAISEGLRQEVKPYGIRSTVISPGAIATELVASITDPEVAKAVRTSSAAHAIAPSAFARAVAFAIEQPDDVDINEIMFRPTLQPL